MEAKGTVGAGAGLVAVGAGAVEIALLLVTGGTMVDAGGLVAVEPAETGILLVLLPAEGVVWGKSEVTGTVGLGPSGPPVFDAGSKEDVGFGEPAGTALVPSNAAVAGCASTVGQSSLAPTSSGRGVSEHAVAPVVDADVIVVVDVVATTPQPEAVLQVVLQDWETARGAIVPLKALQVTVQSTAVEAVKHEVPAEECRLDVLPDEEEGGFVVLTDNERD